MPARVSVRLTFINLFSSLLDGFDLRVYRWFRLVWILPKYLKKLNNDVAQVICGINFGVNLVEITVKIASRNDERPSQVVTLDIIQESGVGKSSTIGSQNMMGDLVSQWVLGFTIFTIKG